MPFVLDIPRNLPGCLNWEDTPMTPKDSSKATGLNRVAAQALPSIPFMQSHYEEDLALFPVPKVLPDIFGGRWSGSYFVSERFRDVVTRVDPVTHLYQPVDLTLLNGKHFPQGYYALGIGGRVDAIDAENSEVLAKSFNGEFAYYAAANGEPHIQWHGDKIAGHHLWIDQHFPSMAFLSDELAKALKKAGVTGLSLRPSAITGGKGRASGGYVRRLARRLRRFRARRYDELDRQS